MSHQSADQLAHEAAAFSQYLLTKQPTPKVTVLYTHALQIKPGQPSASDRKLLDFIVRHPWSAGFIDAGLSVINTDSEVRRRIYVTFSILEAMPEYASRFLPKKRSPLYVFVLLLIGIRGGFRTLVGIILVKAVV